MDTISKIIHIDMDAFFASVEQVENKHFQNKPLIVGKGVVTTCSYEARKFGVRSAMSTKKALELCPNAIVIPPNKSLYLKYSNIIKNIFKKYTNKVESASIDEAYLDVTRNKLNITSATHLAKIIQQDVFKSTGLTCSCGISYNKFLAKSASNIKKPAGIFVITPNDAISFLDKLPIFAFHGIGKKTANKMISLGIYNGQDLRQLSLRTLEEQFQNRGIQYYNIVRGIDNSKVIPNRPIHSISKEITLTSNYIITHRDLSNRLFEIFNVTFNLLGEKKSLFAKTLTVKIKYEDLTLKTKSKSLSFHTANKQVFLELLKDIISSIELSQKVKLYGVGFSNFSSIDETKITSSSTQLKLF